MRSVVAPLYKTPETPEIPAFSLAQQLAGASLSITIGGGNAYWGNGTAVISTSNGTLTGGNPTGTIT
jgi:hypothetical protein